MKIVTKYFDVIKLPNEVKNPVLTVAKDNEIPEDSVNFVRKGLEVYKEPDFNPGEKSVITYISTGHIDRDGDIVLPSGIDLTTYNKHPVVMWGHSYKALPIGRACWIKSDATGMGLIAKTIYANTPEADLVYNYRKDGFPLGTSIGFVPIKYISANDVDTKKEFESELQNALSKGWVTKDKLKDVKHIVQKWALLEFSDVSLPANPEALTIAVNKGLIKKEDLSITEDISTQIEELKPYKTLIEADETEMKELSKEEKTTTPPVDIVNDLKIDVKADIQVDDKIEQKTLDKKGNPSVNDIRNAIYAQCKVLKQEIDAMHSQEKDGDLNYDSYLGLEDLYPIDYPNGHVVLAYSKDYASPCCYYDYKYKYDVTTASCEMGKRTEVEVGYTPKGICVAEIAELKAKAELKASIDENKQLSAETIKNAYPLSVISNFAKSKEDLNVIVYVDEAKNHVYKASIDKLYVQGKEYLEKKSQQALADFTKFVSVDGKTMDEWIAIKQDLVNLYISSSPGKEDILNFCKAKGLKHKDITVEVQKEKLTQEEVVSLITAAVSKNNEVVTNMLDIALARLMGKVQLP